MSLIMSAFMAAAPLLPPAAASGVRCMVQRKSAQRPCSMPCMKVCEKRLLPPAHGIHHSRLPPIHKYGKPVALASLLPLHASAYTKKPREQDFASKLLGHTCPRSGIMTVLKDLHNRKTLRSTEHWPLQTCAAVIALRRR